MLPDRAMRVVMLMNLLCLIPAGCATTRTADKSAIEGVLAAQQAAWNRGDVVAFMDGYARADDIVFTSGGQVRRGYEATLAKYRKSYADAGAMGHLEFELLEVRFLGSDAALVMGRFVLTETPKSGSGLFTLVFERGAQGWRCIHDHTSGDKKKP